jgi:hypothetical protein
MPAPDYTLDSNSNSNSNSDSDNDTLYDIVYDIADKEEEYIDSEKQHGKYYVGVSVYNTDTNSIQLSAVVSVSTLFAYDVRAIRMYLEEYSMLCAFDTFSPIHIMKLDIKPDGEYCIVIKTFWLKIIQRAWKKQFAKWKYTVQMRGSIQSQYYFSIHGRYPQELRHIPGLRGIL